MQNEPTSKEQYLVGCLFVIPIN